MTSIHVCRNINDDMFAVQTAEKPLLKTPSSNGDDVLSS